MLLMKAAWYTQSGKGRQRRTHFGTSIIHKTTQLEQKRRTITYIEASSQELGMITGFEITS